MLNSRYTGESLCNLNGYILTCSGYSVLIFPSSNGSYGVLEKANATISEEITVTGKVFVEKSSAEPQTLITLEDTEREILALSFSSTVDLNIFRLCISFLVLHVIIAVS